MTDRLSDGYVPNWDIDSAVGRQGELYVLRIIDALKGGASIEVKTDDAASKWGRVYLERECLYGNVFRRSGLATTSAELWAQVVASDVAIIAPTWRWKQAAKRAWKSPALHKELNRGSHPTKGVVIPLRSLIEWLMEAEPVTDPATPGRAA